MKPVYNDKTDGNLYEWVIDQALEMRLENEGLNSCNLFRNSKRPRAPIGFQGINFSVIAERKLLQTID